MIFCPISLAVGCQKCLLFKLCPLKSVIGNYKKRGIDRRSFEKKEFTVPDRRRSSKVAEVAAFVADRREDK